VSVIGLGTWQFGSREWGYGRDYSERTAGEIVGRALDLGINLIDTAEIYGPLKSERIVGRALHGQRDRAFVATKIFPIGFPFMTRWRARRSARRLGVEQIDLYQQHWPSPLFSPRSTMPRFRQLVDEGLVRHVGVSNHGLALWQECERVFGGPVLSNQVEFSLLHRSPDRELVPWAQREGRIVIAYSPLGQGLLSGRYDETNAPASGVRAMNPLFLPENLRRAAPLIATLREVAAGQGATPAQVALAWVIRHGCVTAIPGASSVEQLEHNVAAAELELKEDEVAALSAAAAGFRPVAGARAAASVVKRRLRS
jgi:aryl-alcohol dehydrogenase-like predicted oxidoreductase